MKLISNILSTVLNRTHITDRKPLLRIKAENMRELIDKGDVDAIKQILKKEVFFKALVLVIEEQKKGLLTVTNFGDNPCLVWSDESTNRAYRLSFKDGLSHSRLYSNQPYNAGITIPFSLSWEETKFWQDVHSYFAELEKKEIERFI